VPESMTILLVGHCGPDSWALRSAVGRAVPGAAVEFVHDRQGLDARLPAAELALVNRVLDGGFDGACGVDLIATLAPRSRARFMLISNYPEAQAAAVGVGALPGFGKAEMNTPAARERLAAALAATPRALDRPAKPPEP
jgi:hypothetical protein